MGKKSNRMGLGLADLFADNSIEIAEEQSEDKTSEKNTDSVVTVRLSLLEPNREQPREIFDDTKLEELAESIRENGVLQPILVRPLENGGYQIVAGERRWRASRLAGLTEVPVYIKELDDRQTAQVALIENIQRQDLTPIEEALAYQNIMDKYSMTQAEVAKTVGKSRSAVANSLRLLTLSDDVRSWVNDGSISAGHAKVLAGIEQEKQVEFARTVKENEISVRQLEQMISDYNAQSAEQKENDVRSKVIREYSVKKDKPFLKEFEISVKEHSNVRAKAKADSNGGAKVTLEIARELDVEQILTKLAELLEKY